MARDQGIWRAMNGAGNDGFSRCSKATIVPKLLGGKERPFRMTVRRLSLGLTLTLTIRFDSP